VAIYGLRFATRRLERAFETGRILRYMFAAIALLAVGFGFLMWIFDREDFPSLGLALWFAVTTVTTVGYGDVVPVQPVGRLLASVLMIIAFASLSLLTGIIASLLVQRRTTSARESGLVRIEERLDELERLLRAREP
jgi:voltage-gated potassium channel